MDGQEHIRVAHRKYRNDYIAWLVSSLFVFVAVGFVNPLADAVSKYNASFWWQFWYVGLSLLSDQPMNRSEVVRVLGLQAVQMALVSVALGWVLQAVFVMIWRRPGSVSASDAKAD